ncbi:leucine-rich repeat-containing protein 23-like [Oscarella lobularis]|uniref:leucine-rich repeat-containing protein 23-like n=1 Tax=Oscarella lobularis TaxID=121494 RepID=UPI003313CF90
MSDEEEFAESPLEGSEEENADESAAEAEEEEEEDLPPNPLTEEHVKEGISLLCKVGNGISHAYVKLDVRDKQVTEINILNCFVHLRYIDVSENMLRDISALNNLTHLLTLKAENNLLQSIQLSPLPYLQTASFAHNRISTLEGFAQPLLEKLNLSFNHLTDVSGLQSDKVPNLHFLELRGNRLTSLETLRLSALKKLYAAANSITSLEGIEHLTRLTILHVRDNGITQLDGFGEKMVALQYINIRNNGVTEMTEVAKLKTLPMLRALVLDGNPVADAEDYRVEVLIVIRRLERLDKDEFNEEERGEAEELYEQRKKQETEGEGDAGEDIIASDGED